MFLLSISIINSIQPFEIPTFFEITMYFYIVTISPPKQNENKNKIVLSPDPVELINTFAKKKQHKMCISM